MNKIKDKIVVTIFGVVAVGLVALILGPFIYTFLSAYKDIESWESKKNYRYVYAIPKTSLLLQTYFNNDSLYTFIGSDTIKGNCSYFGVSYFSDLTLVVMEIGGDSLVYLADHNNDVNNICNRSVKIEHISKGFENPAYYDRQYTSDSVPYYVFKKPCITRVCIYSGRVMMNDTILHPIIIMEE